ncbi:MULTISPECIES: TonB-dependent siderophore receptor [unclassified Janthinobacterium]|uniref:TonB-dependent receptor plug domain-containing protein n=1 Tax=unclassified Janthinobacterium TaxID=2610881 RepID=UPI001614C3C9|nr:MULTISPECIES: TonB-dependent receptor [unclassified Janthinobacterium]MBB5605773.1 iron complex outermembrane receptor protein [Janthinobacterium sp. S3T4]MBB5611308.1 iron complex outermembrane receptor protein [Janthinobacterium sp. S3M3]
MPTQLKLKPLCMVVLAALSGATWQVHAQTPSSSADNTAAATPPAVVVTGSRIPRASLEGPSSVTILTGEEITRQGYKNVFDALSNQVQNSGFTQGEDFGNTFTPSANTISLRGLGPNHTLILLNGRRLADFPVAYEGTVNFTNLANIPSSIVDRIEILNGGASAIYGSDAIAGVVNVILKKQTEGIDINVKAGGTTRGGAGNQRVQVTGGGNFDKLHTLFSVELSQRDPLSSLDRDFMATKGGTPTNIASRRVVKAGTSGTYQDLGDTCNQFGDLFGGSVVKYQAKNGTYCASPKVGPTYWTTQTKNKSQNAFGSANYELSPDTTLFADFLIGKNATENNTRGPSWTSSSTGSSYFKNQNTGNYEAWTRYISPEEIGGVSRYNRKWDDLATAISIGAKGRIPGTASWQYEANYNASLYKSESHTPRALANIDTFFLGPKLGTDANGVPVYAPDPSRLSRRLTPAEFDSITGNSDSDDKAWTNTLSLSTNGDLFQLPGGVAKVATIAELGKQGFSNVPDPRLNAGYFNVATKSDITAGTRTRGALGAELNLPLHEKLIATLAGRYDRYSFAGRNDGKFTYNGGLELRPAPDLLFRANYATSFRAPDMNYIYKARGTGYYSSTTDYYRCGVAKQDIDKCDYANLSPGADYIQNGSKDLQSEKGKSFGVGAVWSPSTNFDVSVDYWNIKITDLVTNLSADKILRDEADCRLGKLDITSPTCVDTLARVQRYASDALNRAGEIKTITVNPINAASQSTSGIDISLKYLLPTNNYGRFAFKANYSKVLTSKSQQFAGDEVIDGTKDLNNTDWPDKLNLSVNWSAGKWSNTLLVSRYGKIPNGAGTAYLTPTALANISTVYQINDRATISLIVNNVLDTIKRDDSGGWPYYPVGSYSPQGRQGWVEFNYHF